MTFETRVLRTADEKSCLWDEAVQSGFTLFDQNMLSHRTYIVAFEAQAVVGLVCLVESSARIPGALGIGFLETHRLHRNRGVAKALVNGLFEFASRQGKHIANTSYEPDGERWLAPLMRSAAQRYPHVALHER